MGNRLADNPETGILLDHGNRNEFSANYFSNNGDGLVVSGDANTVTGNRLSGPLDCPDECGFGISLESGTGNVIDGNTVLGYHRDGIRAAAFESSEAPDGRDTISGNLVRGTAVDGLLVESTAADTVLDRNTAIGAGDDGIDVGNAATTLTRNPRRAEQRPRHRGRLGRHGRRWEPSGSERQRRPVHERRVLSGAGR